MDAKPAEQLGDPPQSEQPKLTKSQQKKMKRQMKIEEKKKLRKLRDKEKKKLKQQQKQLSQPADQQQKPEEPLFAQQPSAQQPSAQQPSAQQPSTQPKCQEPEEEKQKDGEDKSQGKLKNAKQTYQEKQKEGVRVIIDCQFQDLLTDKEFRSLCQQLAYCHSFNKRCAQPVQYIITSFRGKIKDKILHNSGDQWGIQLLEQNFQDIFPKEELVYLTGDCDTDMEALDKSKVYIIGGLVDHNRLKNLTQKKADELGIQMQRLPITKHVTLESSQILAVNHVFSILVDVHNGLSWKDSFEKNIPKRKFHKESSGSDEEGDAAEDEQRQTEASQLPAKKLQKE